MKCSRCGINDVDTTDTRGGICHDCLFPEIPPHTEQSEPVVTYPVIYNSGWVCPKCGTVYAPHVQGCVKCNNPMEITY